MSQNTENVIYHPVFFDEFEDIGPEELEEIPQILDGLSANHQEVLLLHANGLDYEQISDMTGIGIGKIRSRLHFARRHAHQVLEKIRKEENEKCTRLEWRT